MSEHIRLNFILSLDSVPRPLELSRYETIKSIKNLLRRGISCQTDWTPQQVHYNITLYNQHYTELPDEESLSNLERDGIIWNEDNIFMILTVDSGRVIDKIDIFSQYLRKICIGLRPMTVREDPNHNYMFTWIEKPPESYAPPPITVYCPENAPGNAPGIAIENDTQTNLISSVIEQDD